jgi:quercetin dioxygenase-like cupin family protein
LRGCSRSSSRASDNVRPMAAYDRVSLSEIEPEGPSGAVKFVRRRLGAEAFGINHFTLPAGAEGVEHDHGESGQEEVLFILSGSGMLHVEGDEVPLAEGDFVRIDPEATRKPVAGPDGLVWVAVGAPRKTPYEARGPF